MRKNGILFVVMATLVVASMIVVGCGGGSSTPTEPKPPAGATPTPTPSFSPSITFVSATPPCGSTVNSSAENLVTFRLHVVAPQGGNVSIVFTSPQGNINMGVGNGVINNATNSSGIFIDVNATLAGDIKNVTTTGVIFYLYPGNSHSGTVLATDQETCGYTILPQ